MHPWIERALGGYVHASSDHVSRLLFSGAARYLHRVVEVSQGIPGGAINSISDIRTPFTGQGRIDMVRPSFAG
jgi:hypothetical protein